MGRFVANDLIFNYDKDEQNFYDSSGIEKDNMIKKLIKESGFDLENTDIKIDRETFEMNIEKIKKENALIASAIGSMQTVIECDV